MVTAVHCGTESSATGLCWVPHNMLVCATSVVHGPCNVGSYCWRLMPLHVCVCCQVTARQASQWCSSKGNVPSFEASARDAVNVEQAFYEVARRALALDQQTEQYSDFPDQIRLGASHQSHRDRDQCSCWWERSNYVLYSVSQLTLWCPLFPYLVKPSFVIFDIRALWCSALSIRVPGCQKLQMMAWSGLAQDAL